MSLRALIDAGVHFGHQTRRWNPKMRPYIYGARNGIHIIDLDQTAQLFRRAFQFVSDAVARGGHVLMVGTKRQAADVVREEAQRTGQFFVTGRWLGGTLTNFRTVKGGIERLRELERQDEEGELELLTKKEAIRLRREKDKLDKYIGGIKMMNALPAVMFVIDPNHEHIAVREGRKLHIPIVALTDTNCDPDLVDFVIPGNDDAIRSIKLVTSRIADACADGAGRRRDSGQQGYGSQASGGVQVEFQRGRRRGGGRGRN
ncbi:MAG: 30S ribosomal protein S2 [Myxococcota bacterium]